MYTEQASIKCFGCKNRKKTQRIFIQKQSREICSALDADHDSQESLRPPSSLTNFFVVHTWLGRVI